MPITLLYGCCQIETCARDLDAARRFLVEVLGGVPAEQELARQISDLIPGDDYAVDHVDCGEAIFQINRPSPSMTWKGNPSVHQRYLDERGPCVTNLNFYVDDIDHARELLTDLGAATLIEGPSTSARALADYGPENTREGGDARPFLFMGTRHLIGFDLEIMEPNFLHVSRQQVQYPAYLHPRPCEASSDLLLQRLIVDVADLGSVKDNLRRIFAPASRSNFYCATAPNSFRMTSGASRSNIAKRWARPPAFPRSPLQLEIPSGSWSRRRRSHWTLRSARALRMADDLPGSGRSPVGRQ